MSRPYKDLEELRKYAENKIIIDSFNNIECKLGLTAISWGVYMIYLISDEDPSYENRICSLDELYRNYKFKDGSICGID